MKRQDECFKAEAHRKWNTYVGARKRSCKNTLTNKSVPFYRSHLCLLPAPLISLLTQIKMGSGDHRYLATLQVTTLTNISSSPLFPICYLLLEITPSKLQSVCHKHTLFCWEICLTGTANPPQKKTAS